MRLFFENDERSLARKLKELGPAKLSKLEWLNLEERGIGNAIDLRCLGEMSNVLEKLESITIGVECFGLDELANLTNLKDLIIVISCLVSLQEVIKLARKRTDLQLTTVS